MQHFIHTHRFFVLAALLLANICPASGQVGIPCPVNIDLAFGNFTNWALQTGFSNCSGSCVSAGASSPVFGNPGASGAIPGRLMLTTGSTFDIYGGFPIAAPGGGLFSMRLGKDSANYRSERARYMVHVPAGDNDYAISVKCAVVLNGISGHTPDMQASFTIRAIDSASGNALPCASLNYNAASPGMLTSSVNSSVSYLPWTAGTLDLSGMAGKNVIVEVTALSCGDGNHWAYGYFDVVACRHLTAAITYCDLQNNNVITLTAPVGYANYAWYRNTLASSSVSANPTVNVPVPAVGSADFYYCVITPFGSNGCKDTLQTRLLHNFSVKAMPDAACNILSPIYLMWADVAGVTGYTLQLLTQSTSTRYIGNGMYYLPSGVTGPPWPVARVTDSNGCFQEDTLQPRNRIYSVSGLNDTTTCPTTSFKWNPVLLPTGLNYTYRWSVLGGNGTFSDTSTRAPGYVSTSSGLDTLLLRVSANGCESYNVVHLRTLPNDFHVSDHDAVCQYTPIIPDVAGDTSFQYTWSPTAGIAAGHEHLQQPEIIPDSSRRYTITASYKGCQDIVHTVNVPIEPRPIVSVGADTFFKCPGVPLPIDVSVGPSWFSKYNILWRYDPGIDSIQSQHIRYNGDADAQLVFQAWTPLGCIGYDSATVVVFEKPSVSISSGGSIDSGESFQINATSSGAHYAWTPSAGLDDTTLLNPLAMPRVTTGYVLTVTDLNGCTATDSVLIRVKGDSTILAVPNAFAPDGINTTLKVLNIGAATLHSFRIYNRWGQLVFQTSNLTTGWDGRYKNQPQPAGVYVYTLDAVTNVGRVIQKSGNITLIR